MKIKTEETWFVINKKIFLSNFPFVPTILYDTFDEAKQNCRENEVPVNLMQHMESRERYLKEHKIYE